MLTIDFLSLVTIYIIDFFTYLFVFSVEFKGSTQVLCETVLRNCYV